VKRLLLIPIVALALSVAAGASAAGRHAIWVGTPTCSATTTTLTCSGRVAGLNPRSPAYAELAAQVMWKCDGADVYTGTFTGEAQIITIHNGEGFTISWTPPVVPPEQPSGCASGTWTRWESSAGQLGVDYEVVYLFIIQPLSDPSVSLSYSFGVIYPT
jgi:hypothetical protein